MFKFFAGLIFGTVDTAYRRGRAFATQALEAGAEVEYLEDLAGGAFNTSEREDAFDRGILDVCREANLLKVCREERNRG